MAACLPPDPPACAAAAPAPAPSRRKASPLDAVGDDLARAFGGFNLLFYAGATAASAGLAFSGADEAIRVAVQTHVASSGYGTAATLTGYTLPVVVAPAVWLTGLALGDDGATGAGSAAVQSLVVTALTTAVLKVAVGRAYPLNGRAPNAPDRLDHPDDARTFRPFQSWSWPLPAWPSGHASAATSVVAALTAYYAPDHLWIPLVGYPVAVAIGAGMLAGDDHWTSDLLAGAVLGQCIGWSVGRAFRARAHGDSVEAPGISLAPVVGPSWQGVAVAGGW